MDELEQARFRIYALEDGAVRAQALTFALRTGLFDRVERSPATFAELSFELGISKRVLPALLAFLTSQRLLDRDSEGRITNTPASSTFLVRESSRINQFFANFQSLITVSAEIFSASAVSSTLKPPKKRSSTTWLFRS